MPDLPDATMSTPVLPGLVLPGSVAPPLAPLVMPKQTLAAEAGLLRRAFGALVARLMPGRANLRRAE